jgi:hypothetical protein
MWDNMVVESSYYALVEPVLEWAPAPVGRPMLLLPRCQCGGWKRRDDVLGSVEKRRFDRLTGSTPNTISAWDMPFLRGIFRNFRIHLKKSSDVRVQNSVSFKINLFMASDCRLRIAVALRIV